MYPPPLPRARPHGVFFVIPALILLSSLFYFGLAVLTWAGEHTMDVVADVGTTNNNYLKLEKGGRYRIKVPSALTSPTTCTFSQGGLNQTIAFTQRFPAMSPAAGPQSTLGVFSAPQAGYFSVTCEGTDRLRIGPDYVTEIRRNVLIGMVLTLLSLLITIGFVVARGRAKMRPPTFPAH